MKVNWSETAAAQLEAIYEYIGHASPGYARVLVDKITRKSEQIQMFPLAGRVVPEIRKKQIREVFESSYRVIYHIRSDGIEVLAVLHGARNLNFSEFDED